MIEEVKIPCVVNIVKWNREDQELVFGEFLPHAQYRWELLRPGFPSFDGEWTHNWDAAIAEAFIKAKHRGWAVQQVFVEGKEVKP